MKLTWILILSTVTMCTLVEKPRALTFVEEGDRLLGIDVPSQLLRGHDPAAVEVVLEGSDVPMLGELVEAGGDLRFIAHVPLTAGLTYEVRSVDGLIGKISAPPSDAPAPDLIAIYPLSDTVPENLLKCYFKFSKSMQAGRSADFIHLVNSKGDTMKGTFLDLQPELWNDDQTVLTLWLDPGRIKLDLIPNKEFGNPLKKGESYRLHVSSQWSSQQGKQLREDYAKSFYVSDRDDRSPNPELWRIDFEEETSDVILDFKEPLDHELILNAITVINEKGDPVAGTLETNYSDKSARFLPAGAWIPGPYKFRIESRLEDLAGNNLNRLFEVDLKKNQARMQTKAVYELTFVVK